MDNIIDDEPQYKVIKVSGVSAIVQIYHERTIKFRAVKEKGTLKDNNLNESWTSGIDRDGRIDGPIRKRARTQARIAMNAVRRKSKLYR